MTNSCICAMLKRSEVERARMKWVRPAISIIGMVGVTVGFFMGKVEPIAYLLIVEAVVLWWFRSRDEEKQAKP